MRISDRYIGRQILAGTVFAIVLLSTIMVLGSLFQKIRALLVDFGAPPSVIIDFVLGLMPFSLIYTIPWAFLSAVLLVFGRMSGDQELTGFRTAGMSLRRVSAPVFVLGAAFSILCLWLNVEVAPRAQAHVKDVLIRAFVKDPRTMLSAAAAQDGLDRFEKSAEGVRAYIEASDGSHLTNLHLFKLADHNTGDSPAAAKTPAPATAAAAPADGEQPPDETGNSQNVYIHAMHAEAVVDDVKREFRFHLYDSLFDTTDQKGAPKIAVSGEARPVVIPYTIDDKRKIRPKEMTNRELLEFLRSPAAEEMRYDKDKKNRDKWLERVAELHHRYAGSFACLAFAFIGVPLGIKARRRDTSTGIMISIGIGAAYFSIGMFEPKTVNAMIAFAWVPNLVCVLLGLYLFRRAKFR